MLACVPMVRVYSCAGKTYAFNTYLALECFYFFFILLFSLVPTVEDINQKFRVCEFRLVSLGSVPSTVKRTYDKNWRFY